MRSCTTFVVGASIVLLLAAVSHAEIQTVAEHNGNETATPDFKFKNVPSPSRSDAATAAKFTIVDGRSDPNGGEVETLRDGQLPTDEDQPSENFFFGVGTQGGRLLVDLGAIAEVRKVNTYSWHPSTRGPQVYKLYAADGNADDFNPQPKQGTDPEKCGWKRVADVDTRPKEGEGGGQYGVSISDSGGVLGKYRYLLFDISHTEAIDPFGNTFYSEIDIDDGKAREVVAPPAPEPRREIVAAEGGTYQITIDTTESPDLTQWAHEELAPAVQQWYPKIVKMLPSDGYEAPRRAVITFSARMRGVAATGGTRVQCAAGWMRQNLKGEAKGAIVHELVHVVQQYGRARRAGPNAARTPGWLVEGIADYIRWFLYEPETRGAEITGNSIAGARYDASYRVSGNFLNWVTNTYDEEIVGKLNAAAREGQYSEDLWQQHTGHTVQELGAEWKTELEKKQGVEPATTDDSKINTLTDEEQQAGWKLLFGGKDFSGWHNFKRQGVRPGWQVNDGALVCAGPHDAGDLCTDGQYDWFELQLDYSISEGGNSGIMYHVTDQGNAAWATGPEFQLEDNQAAQDPVRCGWLYALYQPPLDPKTGNPLDATKPAGQWNHLRLLISPEKCEHEINGVKYFDYVLGSEDFKQRVARSKFRTMPLFAKSGTGYIALQGDHGQVSFRNIKIRPIEVRK